MFFRKLLCFLLLNGLCINAQNSFKRPVSTKQQSLLSGRNVLIGAGLAGLTGLKIYSDGPTFQEPVGRQIRLI